MQSIWLIVFMTFIMISQAKASNLIKLTVAGGPMTEQEEFIVSEIRGGRPADLMKRFVLSRIAEDKGIININEIGLSGYLSYLNNLSEKHEEEFIEEYGEKLKIRSGFLVKLFAGGFDGVKINRLGVLIANAIIIGELDLSDIEIYDNVILFGCIFKDNVICRDAFFKKHLFFNKVSFIKGVDFHRLKVGRNFFLKKSEFHGISDFIGLKVERDINATEAKFFQDAIFTGMEIRRNVFLTKAIFNGKTDFLYSSIDGLLNADDTKFLNVDELLNFKSINVGREAFFRGAEFYSETDFGGANISGQFSAENAIFYNKEKRTNFNNMKVMQSAFFKGTEFHGPVDFGGILIGGELTLEKAKLMNFAQLNSMRIGGHLFLRESVFEDDADFVSSNINGDFNAKYSKFKGTNKLLFNSIKIGKNAFFDYSEFFCPVDFMHAHINGLFTLQETVFHSKENIKFNNAIVKGSVFFNKSEFNGELDLSFCDFNCIEFVDVNFKRINLEGMTYKDIYAGKDFKNLIALLEKSPYQAQTYKQLEFFLDGQGHKREADEVFIKGKERELSQISWWNPTKWVTFLFWGKLVGYGRNPARVLFLIVPLLVAGTYLFSPEFSSEFIKSHQYVNSFPPWIIKMILSLDRFLPGVDLGLAKHWQPQNLSLSIWLYWYALKISGWITIPIALAAIYTKIK